METLLVLCSAARTGSSLMCDYLTAGGVPTSELRVFKDNANLPGDAEGISKWLKESDTPARGVNPIIHHLHSKPEEPNPANWLWQIVTNIKASRVLWVYLSRHDRVRHAVSYERAIQTGQWATFATPVEAKITISPKQMQNRINNINYQHDWWTAFFGTHKNVMRLFYEDFVADIPGTMERVFDAIGYGEFVPDAKARQKQAHSDVEAHVQDHYQNVLKWSGLWSPEGKR